MPEKSTIITLLFLMSFLIILSSSEEPALEDFSGEIGSDDPLIEGQLEDDQEEDLFENEDILVEDTISHSNDQQPPLYMNNLYSPTIQVSDNMNIFTKGMKNGWQSIISAQPMKPGYVTEVTIQLLTSQVMHFGFTEKDIPNLNCRWIGGLKNGVSYKTTAQTHSIQNNWRYYGSKASTGDRITSKIDLREGKYTIEFLKNGNSMGLAFAGLKDWTHDIYWGGSIYHNGQAFKLLDFKQYK